MLNKEIVDNFLAILNEELVPAMGCTEPIALAYAGAMAREILGTIPKRIVVSCSGNIIKNVRCVTIPNSQGMVGIEAAVTLGVMGGNPKLVMEVLTTVTSHDISIAKEYIQKGNCEVVFLDSEIPLHIQVTLMDEENQVFLEIINAHTNIVKLEKNGVAIPLEESMEHPKVKTNRENMSIDTIKQFADEVDINLIQELMDKQINCNMNIAYHGMSENYGLGLGRVIKDAYPESVITRMKAYTAAASEARMAGCNMPVVINAGSGNQGIACSIPVIVYAREKNITQEKLYRGLILSSLITIYQKEFIGKLSAFCGAVSASCAAGTAITYLADGTVEQIKNTIINTLANIPGIICDGAKISCAAKIATSIDAAYMAHLLAMKNVVYGADTGILKEEIGETISCVGHIGKVGMMQTDKEIIKIMLQ